MVFLWRCGGVVVFLWWCGGRSYRILLFLVLKAASAAEADARKEAETVARAGWDAEASVWMVWFE